MTWNSRVSYIAKTMLIMMILQCFSGVLGVCVCVSMQHIYIERERGLWYIYIYLFIYVHTLLIGGSVWWYSESFIFNSASAWTYKQLREIAGLPTNRDDGTVEPLLNFKNQRIVIIVEISIDKPAIFTRRDQTFNAPFPSSFFPWQEMRFLRKHPCRVAVEMVSHGTLIF